MLVTNENIIGQRCWGRFRTGKAAGQTGGEKHDYHSPFPVAATFLQRLQLLPADFCQSPGNDEINFRPPTDVQNGRHQCHNGFLPVSCRRTAIHFDQTLNNAPAKTCHAAAMNKGKPTRPGRLTDRRRFAPGLLLMGQSKDGNPFISCITYTCDAWFSARLPGMTEIELGLPSRLKDGLCRPRCGHWPNERGHFILCGFHTGCAFAPVTLSAVNILSSSVSMFGGERRRKKSPGCDRWVDTNRPASATVGGVVLAGKGKLAFPPFIRHGLRRNMLSSAGAPRAAEPLADKDFPRFLAVGKKRQFVRDAHKIISEA
jgi:hypothetical protein